MKEKIEIELQYAGADVDDGSMSLEDMLPALQGFSSAYGKIATLENPESHHKLRVTGVRKGSFHILLEAWNVASANADGLQLAANITTIAAFGGAGALKVVSSIIGVIKTTKHTKRKPYTERINADNHGVVITNCENVSLEVPLSVFKIYKENLIAQDLNKMASLLEERKIETTAIKAVSDIKVLEERISLADKGFFDIEEIVVTKTQEMWLTGILNSLTKTTNRGFFYLNDGTRVSYKLAGDRPDDMYPFFVHKGPVKVRCVASLDENLKPAQIDIYEIVPIQEQRFGS